MKKQATALYKIKLPRLVFEGVVLLSSVCATVVTRLFVVFFFFLIHCFISQPFKFFDRNFRMILECRIAKRNGNFIDLFTFPVFGVVADPFQHLFYIVAIDEADEFIAAGTVYLAALFNTQRQT